ncbi:hypothetical protein AB0383_16805 [Amycolatopsis sp. NPDC051373]|uniref:hypothetical protein n=1 Tax=Amycolatopsis sp. NPDC051373 TaxID=3155801 RepID=UPI00344E0CDA
MCPASVPQNRSASARWDGVTFGDRTTRSARPTMVMIATCRAYRRRHLYARAAHALPQ